MKLSALARRWNKANRKQKSFLITLALFVAIILWASNAIVLLGGLLASVGVITWSVVNSNAGFMIVQSGAIPSLIARFNRDRVQAAGEEKSFPPRRTDTSEFARKAALDHAGIYLQSLIGLDGVKEQIKRYEALTTVGRARQTFNHRKSLSDTVNLNMVFAGSPGTGKTSVARAWGDVLFGLGMLDSGHVVEVDRSALVAKYIGQTAKLTLEACQAALDGVLFVDEAYSLSKVASEADYGHEAIETLMKFMEDHKGRISVIVAGYEQQMEQFLQHNRGLKSRFPRKLVFPDYSPEELGRMFEECAANDDMDIPPQGREFVVAFFKKIASTTADFGNARFVLNFYDSCKENHALRLAGTTNVSEAQLNQFDVADFRVAVSV